jgi:hypothetical protein
MLQEASAITLPRWIERGAAQAVHVSALRREEYMPTRHGAGLMRFVGDRGPAIDRGAEVIAVGATNAIGQEVAEVIAGMGLIARGSKTGGGQPIARAAGGPSSQEFATIDPAYFGTSTANATVAG